MSILRSEVTVAEAIARRELGDQEVALAAFEAIADEASDPRMYSTVLAMLELAAMRCDAGEIEAARREFDRALAYVTSEFGGADLVDWVRQSGTVLCLAEGNLDQAHEWSVAVEDSFWGPVGRARVALARGNIASAGSELSEALPRCIRHDVILLLLNARSMENTDDALSLVSKAVELASSHGLLQTVASEGREIMELIERAAWRVSDDWLTRLRRLAIRVKIPADTNSRNVAEPLTVRERDVLRFLPSRLTLNEIAGELYVSVNTLKFHLRVIYRKLGVNSRDEAAAIARKLTSLKATDKV